MAEKDGCTGLQHIGRVTFAGLAEQLSLGLTQPRAISSQTKLV